MAMFKRKVDEYAIKRVLSEFLNTVTNCKMIIYYTVSRRGIVKMYTNRPGILVGPGGRDIEAIRNELVAKANVKDVKIIEMKQFVTNFKEYSIY